MIKKFFTPQHKLTKYSKILYTFSALFFVLIVVLFSIKQYLLKNFNGVSIEEIIFHLKTPIVGTGLDMILNYFILEKKILSIAGIIFLLTVTLLSFNKNIRNCLFTNIIIFVTSTFLLFIGMYNIIKDLDISKYLISQMTTSSFIEENYVSPQNVTITFPEVKRNLIYIYLESMESTFISKQNGGCMQNDIIPELTQLAKQNINFSENKDIGGASSPSGTGWTIAAMVAQTSGLPLLIPVDATIYGEYSEFLPGAISLGDILKQHGYNQEIMVGSDMSFGGRRSYFTDHGEYIIYDLFTARNKRKIPNDYYVWWGFEDSKLFSFAKEEIIRLSQDTAPFNFTLLTVDTHNIGGYFCELCNNEHNSQYENVLSCSSRQTVDFINWLKKQDFYENTTIIVCGDHPSMDDQYIETHYDGSKPRKVYNCFINIADLGQINSKNREFNTLDFFPTTLAALGCKISGERLGLGTNLFSQKQTLSEKYGNDKINEEFSKSSIFYRKNILRE